MTLHIIPRQSWGARSPKNRQAVSWANRTGFVVHHSGANASQSPRLIQDFHMDSRGWSDIGYNFLVDQFGNCYDGRGWGYVGAHAKGYNTATIGVCVIGHYDATLPPRVALNTLRELYALATILKGRRLATFGHRQVGSTDCPGDALYGWVRDGHLVDAPTPWPSPKPTGLHHPGTRELRHTTPEMSGDDVWYVQHFIGPEQCGTADGRYGPKTVAGVRWYQGMRGIGVDGRVGPTTWRNMNVLWTG